MKKVLIPTDFSDNAWDALTYAIRLYDDIPCVFYILNTYETNPSKMPNTMHQFAARKVARLLKKESEENLAKILAHLNDNMLNSKHEYKGISKIGSLSAVIQYVTEKEYIDVIVMGSKGATGLKEIFMGSNTVKVIKEGFCPTVCVPEKYKYEELEQVIFATDFKKHLSKQDVRCLIELQLLHRFNIRFIHIKKESELSEKQQHTMDSLKSYFENDLISFEEIESDAPLSKAITTFAENENANLLCLANYEHSFMEKLTHEPVIKRVGFHTQIPLLILPV